MVGVIREVVLPVSLSDPDSRGQRHHRHRYFRKSRGSSGVKGAELLMPPPSSYGGPAPATLPPRFQPAGHPRPPPPPSPGAMTYDPYAPPHHHPPTARPPRYGASRWDLLVSRCSDFHQSSVFLQQVLVSWTSSFVLLVLDRTSFLLDSTNSPDPKNIQLV